MPVFKDILFIHIPKTGGTSLEKYFSTKYNIPLNDKSLYTITRKRDSFTSRLMNDRGKVARRGMFNGKLTDLLQSSYQHFTLQNIYDHKLVDFYFSKVITIVRNPYTRIMSGLFYSKMVQQNSSQEDVYEAIKKYITLPLDNHPKPQHSFVTLQGKLYPKLIILKTETLKEDLCTHGFDNFNFNENVTKKHNGYMSYLNNDSIQLINKTYELDFQYFGYNIL
jgi:hypothetical protein